MADTKVALDPDMLARVRARDVYGLVAYYEGVFPHFSFPPHMIPVAMALCDLRIKKLAIIIGPGSGKAVRYGTKVLTPNGWVKVEDLNIGEEINTPNGKTTKVMAKWAQPKMPMYELTFKDGRTAVVNGKHLWKCYCKKFRRMTPENPWRVRETEELISYKWRGPHKSESGFRFYIPLTSPIPYKEKNLLIDPYVLGCLLGDGSLTQNYITVTTMDSDMIEFIKKTGIEIGKEQRKKNNRASSYGLKKMTQPITELGLLGCDSFSKFIPEIYKQGSIEQRFALLQGLMDTDGTVGQGKTLSFCTISPQLAKDMRELIYSLGGIVKTSLRHPYFVNAGGKKQAGQPAYQLNIRFPNPEKVFRIARKKQRAIVTQYSDDLKLEITSIEPVGEEESICISVSDPEGLFIIDDYVVTHNSLFLSVVYPAWNLGHDVNQTNLGISASEGLIQGFVRASMEIIEWSPWHKAIFPDCRPDKDAGWSAANGAYVEGRAKGNPDPSYVGAGLTSKSLTGKHSKNLILDDLHDSENSGTAEQRQKVIDKYYSQLMGRQDPQGARIILAGRRWATDDLYGHLMQSENDWVFMTLPAERKTGSDLYWDLVVPDDLVCCFNET